MSNYLTATQAAQRLGTSLTNVARWCRDGTLPATRLGIGRIWQIKAEDVEAFIPPARGPKPVGERKRLLEMARELVQLAPDLVKGYSSDRQSDYWEQFANSTIALARVAGCTRARARQALAKAIRLARQSNV